MRKIRGGVSFSCLVCRASALSSPAVNCSFACLLMFMRNRGRSECPCSGKGCCHVFDTPHSKRAASVQQRNSISNVTVGTRRHIVGSARVTTLSQVVTKWRLLQILVDGARFTQSLQDHLFFCGWV